MTLLASLTQLLMNVFNSLSSSCSLGGSPSVIAGFDFQLHLGGPERVEGLGLWPSFGDYILEVFAELCRRSRKTETQNFWAMSVG